MTKRSENPRPTKAANRNGREISITDTRVCTSKDKNVVYELQYETYLGEQIPYVIYEDTKRYPVNAVGRLFGYDEKSEYRLYNSCLPFAAQYAISARVRGKARITSVPCVDSKGLLFLTGRAPFERMSPERQEKVMKIIQFMAESADLRLKGELVPVTSPVLLTQIIEDRIESCQQVAAAVGCDFTSVLTPELALIEEQTGQKISYLNSLPRQNQYRRAPVFTETELGKQFNVTGTRVKMVLKDKGYLKSIGSRLDFTSVGLLYGEWRPGIEFKGKPRTMVRMRRFWNQDIVPKLEEHFYYLEKAKDGLFTGHLEAIS